MASPSGTVDHFMWAAADLDSGCEIFEELTGVRPAYGGTHPGFGTRNAHPSLTAPTGCQLNDFEVGHPHYRELALLYDRLGVAVPVLESTRACANARLLTPKGEVILDGSL